MGRPREPDHRSEERRLLDRVVRRELSAELLASTFHVVREALAAPDPAVRLEAARLVTGWVGLPAGRRLSVPPGLERLHVTLTLVLTDQWATQTGSLNGHLTDGAQAASGRSAATA
jgi:hypothetical protein